MAALGFGIPQSTELCAVTPPRRECWKRASLAKNS